jgi:hypothetical protein
MTISQLREEIHRLVDQVDEAFLKAVYAMMETYVQQKEGIVGYRPDGTPITVEELEEQIRTGEEQIDKGESHTIESLKKEMQEWFDTRS